MAEVLARSETQLGGVFVSDSGKLSFGGGVPSALVQNVQFTASRNISRLYEIGSINNRVNVYYVTGRMQGTATIGRVIGPSPLMGAFYTKFGNPCNARNNTITLTLQETDCQPKGRGGFFGVLANLIGFGNNNQAVYTLKFCVLQQVTLSLQAQDMIINENSSLMFSGLDFEQQ